MKNKYEHNLRTHYAPLKRSKYYFSKNQNSCLNKTENIYDNKTKSGKSPIYNNGINLKYKTPIKISKTESRNENFFNLNYKKNTDSNIIKKQKISQSLSDIHPFFLNDKIKLFEKEKINEKVKNTMHLQREAVKQLSLYKIKNPSKKEILQKINELSANPLLAYEPRSPLYIKTIENYYYNDNFVKNSDINIFNKPRKEIDEYYNKCQFSIPTTYSSGTIIHTKAKYIYPKLEKIKFEKQIQEEIIKHINKKHKKEENKINDVKNGIRKNKIYNEFGIFLKNKEKYQKLNKEKEIILDNNLLTEYNQYVKSHLNYGDNQKYQKIRLQMEKEDLHEEFEKKQEKMRTRQILYDWDIINKKAKVKRNNDKIKEKKMWRNYSEKFEIKYNTKNNFRKFYKYRNNYSKDNIHKTDDNYY